MFSQDVEYPSEISLVGGTRGKKGLIMNNSPNSEHAVRGNTGPMLETCLLEESGSGICGAAVDYGAMFCMLSMD